MRQIVFRIGSHSRTCETRNIKYIEELKQSIIDGLAINGKSNPIEFFPKTLSVVEQGNFFVGYYQQRTVFMNKRKPTEENEIINN